MNDEKLKKEIDLTVLKNAERVLDLAKKEGMSEIEVVEAMVLALQSIASPQVLKHLLGVG